MVLFSMKKQKRWHSWLIATVSLLTVYNILPTILFYANPLSDKIGAKKAIEIQNSIADRVNRLESDSTDWIYSFSQLIGVKIKSVEIDPVFSDKLEITFNQSEDAKKFTQIFSGGKIQIRSRYARFGAQTKSKTSRIRGH